MADEINKIALTPEDYWKWRVTIEEWKLAQSEREKSELRLKLMAKETEVMTLQTQIYSRTHFEAAKLKVDSAKEEYDKFKKILEEKLGISLSDKMIDEFTYEVKEVPKN